MKPEPSIQESIASDAQSGQDVMYYLKRFNPFTFHKRGRRGKALFALALVSFLWGVTWLASKEGVKHMPPLQLAGIRQTIGGLCYVVFFLAKKLPLPRGREWAPVVWLSVLNFMLSNALSTWGVQYISAGLGAIIGAIFPLWLVIITLVGSRTRLPGAALAGLLLGFSGICVIFYDHLADFLNPQFRLGIFLSVASTWSWAFGTLYTKKQATRFNPYFSLGLQMVISGTTLLLLTELTGIAIPIATIAWQAWAAIGFLALFGSVLAFVAYLYALQNLPTQQVSLYAYINPVVAVLCGWILFGEKLTGPILGGTALTLAGVWLVNRAAVRKLK